MNPQYKELVDLIKENLSEFERWQVFSDKLMGDGDPRGEHLALDVALRNGLESDEARHTLREARVKVWQDNVLKEIPEYFLQDKFWMGAFPLKFPNQEKLEELDRAFVVDEFPHYELLFETTNYALGVHQLQRHCEAQEKSTQPTFPRGKDQTIYRPFTFRESMLARVEDFYMLYDENGTKRSEKDRLRLFNVWLDSCTGIAYKADSTKFKIILQSPHLIGINEEFNQETITEELTGGPLEYDSLAGIELDGNRGTYNRLLTEEQVMDYPGWNAAVEEDKPLLKEYTHLVFSQRQGNNMAFWLRHDIKEDHLRALFVNNLINYSSAIGYGNLSSYGHFLAR